MFLNLHLLELYSVKNLTYLYLGGVSNLILFLPTKMFPTTSISVQLFPSIDPTNLESLKEVRSTSGTGVKVIS